MTIESWLMVAILGTTFGLLIFSRQPPAAVFLGALTLTIAATNLVLASAALKVVSRSRLAGRTLAAVLCMALLAACTTTVPIEQREERRAEINRDAEETIALLAEREPGFTEALEQSAGYFSGRISSATVAVVGGAVGTGVLVDNRTGDRTFMDIKQLELGAGLGKRGYRVLVLAQDTAALDRFRERDYIGSLATEATVGQRGGTGIYGSDGLRAFVISDSGASVAAVARLARTRVNTDLTDTGISEVRVPNIDFGIEDGREPVEQRTWEHKLPFMAQDVIDMGYDLPLPYGVKLLYSDIEQDQTLEHLEVGFSGGEKVPYEWVEFENAVSWTDTWQMIGDVWLFPFLNVFAFVGDLKGDVTLDVYLDGNGLLEQAGIDCSQPGNLVICRLLQDQVALLPVESDFTGLNYGVGFNLAGGWNGWFVTLPVSFSWVDMDTTITGPVSWGSTGTSMAIGRSWWNTMVFTDRGNRFLPHWAGVSEKRIGHT